MADMLERIHIKQNNHTQFTPKEVLANELTHLLVRLYDLIQSSDAKTVTIIKSIRDDVAVMRNIIEDWDKPKTIEDK